MKLLLVSYLMIVGMCSLPSSSSSVKIGTQEWMVKNLDVDRYRNGDPIPQVQDVEAWSKLKSGAWCYYDDMPELGAKYGKLYNWYAVNDPRGLAPDGWHIPSKQEWEQLIKTLGGEGECSAKLKNISGWGDHNGTNESGFSALPGGVRTHEGNFGFIDDDAQWWSSTDWSATNSQKLWAWSCRLHYDENSNFSPDNSATKGFGLSIRCVKN